MGGLLACSWASLVTLLVFVVAPRFDAAWTRALPWPQLVPARLALLATAWLLTAGLVFVRQRSLQTLGWGGGAVLFLGGAATPYVLVAAIASVW